jgi:hypothetical protein
MTGPQIVLACVLFGLAGVMLAASLHLSSRKEGIARVEAGVWFWVILLGVFGIGVLSSHWTEQGSSGPGYHVTPNQVGYENPAPGNDGTIDCPPGGGPVYVGSNDPNGYDGDGDGIGCE